MMHYLKSAIIKIGGDAMTLPGDLLARRLYCRQPTFGCARANLSTIAAASLVRESYRKAKSVCPRSI